MGRSAPVPPLEECSGRVRYEDTSLETTVSRFTLRCHELFSSGSSLFGSIHKRHTRCNMMKRTNNLQNCDAGTVAVEPLVVRSMEIQRKIKTVEVRLLSIMSRVYSFDDSE